MSRGLGDVYKRQTQVGSFTMGDLKDDCLAVTAADTAPVWIDNDFIESQETGGGNAFPIWVPPGPEYGGAARCSGARAVAAGLHNRPTRETARDTVSWWQTLPAERRSAMRAGLSADIEAKILENWHYWFVIDLASIYLYANQGLWLTVGLFVIYLVLVILGYRQWRASFEAHA